MYSSVCLCVCDSLLRRPVTVILLMMVCGGDGWNDGLRLAATISIRLCVLFVFFYSSFFSPFAMALEENDTSLSPLLGPLKQRETMGGVVALLLRPLFPIVPCGPKYGKECVVFCVHFCVYSSVCLCVCVPCFVVRHRNLVNDGLRR